MEYDDRDRFVRMAKDYDRVVPVLVPRYDFLQEEMLALARLGDRAAPRVADLGAGGGRFLERVLAAHPRATAWWVDSSEGFRSVAQRRLERFGDRVRFVLSPIEADWESQVEMPLDAVFSMSAIHHLDSAEKRALYARAAAALAPGGWLLNCDEMKGFSEESYRASLEYWVAHVHASHDRFLALDPAAAQGMLTHFARWTERNVTNFGRPKTKGDDLHDPVADQLDWFREAGLQAVDLYVKDHLWCLIGGHKGNR